MRTRRLITAGAATAATLMLLAASPNPTNANTQAQDTNTNPGITAIADAKIAAVQSRADQHPTNTEGNAVELRNPTDIEIQLNGASLQVFNSASAQTASFNFDSTHVIPPDGSILIRDPDFLPTPRVIPASLVFTPGAGTDTIPDRFGVALYDNSPTPVQVDSLATELGIVDGNSDPVGEGNIATALQDDTDPFNAAIRRDVLYVDSGDNEDDFQRRPAMWGVPL